MAVIRHECDTPSCVRHVVEGSHADNVNDKTIRGRTPRGDSHHWTKLSERMILEVRELLASGVTGRALASKYGVSEGTISMVRHGLRRGASKLSPNLASNGDLIREANRDGFTINLSADSLEDADRLTDMEIGPVAVVVAHDAPIRLKTPAGRRVTICPAESSKMTCDECRLCANPKRKTIIGFRAHGQSKAIVSELVRERRTK